MEELGKLQWLYGGAYHLAGTVLSCILIYVFIIVVVRINGLRTFAKMGSFDFAITIAIGSLIATTILNEGQSVAQGAVALVVLVGLQALVAALRRRSRRFQKLVTNTPLMLMDKGRILHGNLKVSRVSASDLYAKLREANITRMEQVLAVVLETTGDISVISKNKAEDEVEEEILRYVVKKPEDQA